jgi:hypothetical protein
MLAVVECLGGDVTVLVVLPLWEVATATLVFLFAIQGTGLWIDVGDDVRLASDRTESMVVESEEEMVEEAETEVNADEVATAKTGDGGDEDEAEPLTTRCLGPSGMPKAEATGARMPVIARYGAGGGCACACGTVGSARKRATLGKAGLSVLPESR